MKLSKSHIIEKVAEETKVVANDTVILGADVKEADDALEDKTIVVADHDPSKQDGDMAADKNGKDKEEEDEDGDADDGDPKKYDARLEAAMPYANAVKDLYNKRRELMTQINALDDQLGKHREVLRALDPKVKHQAYADDKELRGYLKPEKEEKKKKRKKKLDAHAEREVVEGLLKVADLLDYAGDSEGVSYVESMLHILAKKDEDFPKKYDVQTIEKEERKYPEPKEAAPSLSVRYCPDHHGVQMQRVAEGSFQCELDGRVYNWNEGFTDYEGRKYIAAPIRSVDFPDMNERLFENRSMALSKRQK